MESRKLVKSGNTSFTITLPIDWIRKNNLDAGSNVHLDENQTGDIILRAGRKARNITKTHAQESINIDEKNTKEIELELIIQYVRDSPALILQGKQITNKAPAITRVTQELIGFEIIDQSPNSISIKNFFRLDDETSPRNMVKKLFQINQTALSIVEKFFQEGLSKQEVYEIEQFAAQSKKLSYVAEKGILAATQDPSKIKTIRTNKLELLKQKTYVAANRRITIYLSRIAELLNLVNKDDPGVDAFKELFEEVQQAINSLARSIFNGEIHTIKHLLIATETTEKRIEEHFSRFEDSLLLQANTLLFALNQEVWDLSYEALL